MATKTHLIPGWILERLGAMTDAILIADGIGGIPSAIKFLPQGSGLVLAIDGIAAGSVIAKAGYGLANIINQLIGNSGGSDNCSNENKDTRSSTNAKSQPSLKRLYPDSTLKGSGNKSSYNYWSKKSTQDIIDSLKPGQKEPLIVDQNGKIWQGNTRSLILEERGFNINNLH